MISDPPKSGFCSQFWFVIEDPGLFNEMTLLHDKLQCYLPSRPVQDSSIILNLSQNFHKATLVIMFLSSNECFLTFFFNNKQVSLRWHTLIHVSTLLFKLLNGLSCLSHIKAKESGVNSEHVLNVLHECALLQAKWCALLACTCECAPCELPHTIVKLHINNAVNLLNVPDKWCL